MNKQDSLNKTIVLGVRVAAGTFKLLDHISTQTKIRKSMLIRAALTQWLQNAPPDLPLDLKIEITRANIQHQIDTVKNLRWIYHKKAEVDTHLFRIEKQEWLSPHAIETIKQIENQILTLQNQLDTWIKQQYTNKQSETP